LHAARGSLKAVSRLDSDCVKRHYLKFFNVWQALVLPIEQAFLKYSLDLAIFFSTPLPDQ
jgi:hypothetical protein